MAHPLDVWIEELGAATMLASADDRASVERLCGLLVALAREQQGEDAELSAEASACAQALVAALDGPQGACAAALADAEELLRTVQERRAALVEGAARDSAARAAGAAEASAKGIRGEREVTEAVPGGRIELPPWVDEGAFRAFLAGQRAGLDDIEADVLGLEGDYAASLANLRRRLHSLKGESGVVGLDELGDLCHATEELLELGLAAPVLGDVLLQVRDWLTRAFDAYAALRHPSPSARSVQEGLIAAAAARGRARKASGAPWGEGPPIAQSLPAGADAGPAAPVTRDQETITVFGEFLLESEEGLGRADRTLMDAEREGADEEKVNELFRTFHTIKGVACSLELSEITSLAHQTETMLNAVRKRTLELRGAVLDLVFDATATLRQMLSLVRVAVEGHLSVAPVAELPLLLARIQQAIDGNPPPPASLPDVPPGARLGEILIAPPLLIPPEQVERALEAQRVSGRRLGEELVATGAANPRQVVQALRAQAAAQAQTTSQLTKLQDTIKIDVGRVDCLVEMIGELVIVESMVTHAPEIAAISSPPARAYLGQLTKIARDLQGIAMRMRMVPVRGVFQKMARLVRDLSRKSGKLVRFVQTGEGTDMDRSMVEQIADPLVHMIRNAVDHGIDPPEERVARGKPAAGTIHLSAYHEGGSIVIEVRDDGRGLDREAIVRKARAQGLVKEEQKLTDGEVHNLIFAPGFSTATQVTEISGRGVGMDVVRRNIEALRGRIVIATAPGDGTTFKLILPLTLAIIDGTLVECGAERYIVPTLSIVESIKPEASMLVAFAGQLEMMSVRGQVFPLVRLDRLLQVEGAKQDPTSGLIVVTEAAGRRVGVLVDEVVAQQQVVIKSLGTGLDDTRYVSGAAILPDGRVGLILNVDEISGLVEAQTASAWRSDEASAAE